MGAAVARAFAAASLPVFVFLLVEVAAFASRHSIRIEERLTSVAQFERGRHQILLPPVPVGDLQLSFGGSWLDCRGSA